MEEDKEYVAINKSKETHTKWHVISPQNAKQGQSPEAFIYAPIPFWGPAHMIKWPALDTRFVSIPQASFWESYHKPYSSWRLRTVQAVSLNLMV